MNAAGRPGGAVYKITCTLCGQSWQQSEARSGESVQCLFCGSRGRLQVGPRCPDGAAHIEARLECSDRPWY